MTTFQRILFPVDFSEQCKAAGRYVAAYAREFGAEVDLLHVEELPVEPSVWIPTTQALVEMLDRFMEDEFAGLRVHRFVETGSPAREIVRYAEERPADAVMMATHGRGPFRRFLLGSVANQVLHDAPCPVWTAAHLDGGPAAEAPGPAHFRHLLCAVDLDETGAGTLSHARELARRFQARLTVAHAVPAIETWPQAYMDNEFQQHLIELAKTRLGNMMKTAGIEGVPCVGAGNIAEFVRHAAKSHNAGLVLIGRGRHGLLGRLRTHDYAIIRACGCPVLSF